jgi:hypothetical protein
LTVAKKKKSPAGERPNNARIHRHRTGGRGGLRALVLTFSLVVLGLLVFAAPALVLFFVGMAPTAVALIIDRDPQKYAAISVSATNFAGLSPYLADFIFGTPTFSRAIELVADVFVLVVIYGAAAAGWVLILLLPPVTAIVLKVMAESRIQSLRKEQRQLVEDWGETVTGQ